MLDYTLVENLLTPARKPRRNGYSKLVNNSKFSAKMHHIQNKMLTFAANL